jgi:excisionase family DNA binding protein
MSEDLISSGECAKLRGISRQAISKAIERGDLPAQRVGRYFVIKKCDCESYAPAGPAERGLKGANKRWASNGPINEKVVE